MTEPKKSIADGVGVKPFDETRRDMNSVPFVGDAYGLGKSISDYAKERDDDDGVAADAGALVGEGAKFVAGCAVDALTMVLDPLNWLVSNGLDMLLNLIQPLQDALHEVTGDGPSIGHAAENFSQIGEGFVALAEDFNATGDKALAAWTEDAGDAAKAALGDFSVGIKGVGTMSGSVADTLRMWSMVMVVIEETVKAIISELVSFLITLWLPALAASIMSFGSSVAAAMSASIAKAAAAFTKVTKHLGKLGKLLDKFMKFLVKLPMKARMDRLGVAVGGIMARDLGQNLMKSAAGEMAKAVGKKAGMAGGIQVGTKGPGVLKDESEVGGEQTPEETKTNLDM